MCNIPLLAKIVSRQSGISIVFSDTASTASINLETKVCTLPTVMISSGKESDATLLRGLIVHEAVGHGRHTDVEALKTIKTPFEADLNNVLEDIRIERAAWLCYPGAKGMLFDLVDYLSKDKSMDFFGQFITEKEMYGNSATGVLLGFLLSFLRKTCLSQPLEFNVFESVATAYFGDELLGKIKDIALKCKDASSTAECLVLTNQIIQLLKDASDEPEQPESGESGDSDVDGQGDDESDSDDSGGDSEGNPSEGQSGKPSKSGKSKKSDTKDGESDDKGNSSGQSKDKSDEKSKDKSNDGSGDKQQEQDGDDKSSDAGKSQKSDKKDDSSGQPDTDGSDPEAGKPGDVKANAKAVLENTEQVKTDLEDMVAQIIEELVKNMPEASSSRSVKGKLDSVVSVVRATPTYDENSVYKFNRGNSIKLSSKLEDLLEAKVETDEEYGSKGLLATKKLSRIKLLDSRVFVAENSETEGLDTSVFILGDMSGSMGGSNSIHLMDAVLSLSTSLEKNEVPFAISYFNSRIHEVKSFSERFAKVKGRIQQFYNPSGNTPIFESMVYAAMKAIQTSCKRKILLVVTDGTFGSSDLDIKAFNNTLTKYQSDLEVRFVLIGNGMKETHKYLVENKVKTGTAVNSDEITKAMFDSLQNVF